jgi:hypothetical protein
VSRKNAAVLINEVYSYSLLDRIRRLSLIDRWLYPVLRDYVYQGRDPYITPDEGN